MNKRIIIIIIIIIIAKEIDRLISTRMPDICLKLLLRKSDALNISIF